MRSIHLSDLPSNLVFIYFEDEFRKHFLEKAKRTFGTFEKLGEFVGYTATGIMESFRVENRFTKLSTIIKLANFLYKNGNPDFDMNKIEKKIIAYRGIGTSLIIKNPNFPLKENEKMIRILFHLLGDGYGGKYGGGKPFYRNYCQELLDEFEEDLRVFGRVPFIRRETSVEIPSVIGYILKHIYKINFESHKSHIPQSFFTFRRELIAQGIKAFADDEANVDDCRIKIFSCNTKLLSGIKNLMFEKFPGLSVPKAMSIIQSRNTRLQDKWYTGYHFSILSPGIKSYYDLIGFTHPAKSQALERIIERRSREWQRRNKNITKLLILRSIKNKHNTVKEISWEVGVTKNTVRSHFMGNKFSGVLSLLKMGFVRNAGLNNTRAKIWVITERGLKFLEENKKSLDQSLIKGDTRGFYLRLVREFSQNQNWAMPSKIAKKINQRNDTVSKRLLKLYKNGYLVRKRCGKQEYKYRLAKKEIN